MKRIAHLRRLLEPQERLDQLVGSTIRRFGPKAMDLSYANVYDGPDEEILRVLELTIRERRELAFQYTPYGGRATTRRLIADELSREYGHPFTFRDIVLTPGAMAALNVVFRPLFGRNDEIIVLTPCWHDYLLYLRNLNIRVAQVPLANDKHLDCEAVARAINRGTRGVLLSQPCCPTGVVYTRSELEELAQLLQAAERRYRTPIYLISDEVHRHMVWSGTPYHSPMSLYPRCLSIYSFGKALALQGQRIGYVAVSPRMPESSTVRQALEQCVRLMGFCMPTELMQRAICRLIEYRPQLDRLAEQQRSVRAHLAGCGYEVCDGEGTFFVYVKCPVADDLAFAESLASHGVLVVPSTLFHEPGYFRISLTARQSAVTAALPIFAQAATNALQSTADAGRAYHDDRVTAAR